MEKSVFPGRSLHAVLVGRCFAGGSAGVVIHGYGTLAKGSVRYKHPSPADPRTRGAAPPAAGAARSPCPSRRCAGRCRGGLGRAPHCAGPFLSARCRRRSVCRRVCHIHRLAGQTWGPLSASPPNKWRKRLFKVFPPSRSRAFPLILLRESSWLYWVSLCPGILRNMRLNG